MSYYLKNLKKEFAVHIKPIRDDINQRKNKEFFWFSGTQVYSGRQGSGKTISAVKHVLDMKKRYPKAKLVSNLNLSNYKPRKFTDVDSLTQIANHLAQDEYILFQTLEELALVLTHVNNEFRGVIYLIDEIHTYFNALESKNVPMYVFTEISQQRKQRKVIIGTSQLFTRMAKPFREQCDSLIVCNTWFGAFTFQTAYDGMEVVFDEKSSRPHGTIKKRGFFWHTRELRNSFDTYQKVISGVEQYNAPQIMEVTKRGKTKHFI